MAEIVDYRVEKSYGELELLIEFGLYTKEIANEIIAKRREFEYALRKRTRSKLDYLKYIKYEMNILDSLEKYRKTTLENLKDKEKTKDLDDVDRRLLLLQTKKLNDIIRSRSGHISSLFRKLATSFQFDETLWLAYIEYAKGRNWNSRVSALYWRLLRVAGGNASLWAAAAQHEIESNKTYDVARGLFLRALRQHPKCLNLWLSYFGMELKFMDIIDRRAKIIFNTAKSINSSEKGKSKDEADWDEDPGDLGTNSDDDASSDDLNVEESTIDDEEERDESLPNVEAPKDDEEVLNGLLPKIIYDNATKSLGENVEQFILGTLKQLFSYQTASKGLLSIEAHIKKDIEDRVKSSDGSDQWSSILSTFKTRSLSDTLFQKGESTQPVSSGIKRAKISDEAERLNEIYQNQGILEARAFFRAEIKKKASLNLYIDMIKIELLDLDNSKDKLQQIDRIRYIIDTAIRKFGDKSASLWCLYLRFEYRNCNKTLEDLDRIQRLYKKATSTLVDPSNVEKVIEMFTLLQAGCYDHDPID